MATNYNYPDPTNIEEASKYRPGIPTRLLNVLTGGLAGQITGTTERAQEAARARQALIEEDVMMKRMKAQRQLMLEDELKTIAAREAAAAETRAKETSAKREAQRPTLIGQLRARPDYQLGGSMAMPVPALESTESLEEQAAYEEAKMKQEEEARKLKTGYIQYNIPGKGIVGGTMDQILKMAERDPVIKKFIETPVSEELPYITTWDRDPLTGQMNPTVRFTKPVPFAQQKALVDQFFGNQSTGFGQPPPPTGTTATGETQPTDIPGYRVKFGRNQKM